MAGPIYYHQSPPGDWWAYFFLGSDYEYAFVSFSDDRGRVSAACGYHAAAEDWEYTKRGFDVGPLSLCYECSNFPGEPPDYYSDEAKAAYYFPTAELSATAPGWLLPLLFAAYPIVAFRRGPLRRWRRHRRGGCLKCGYDLTGNVSGVCPECGTAIQNPETRKPETQKPAIEFKRL